MILAIMLLILIWAVGGKQGSREPLDFRGKSGVREYSPGNSLQLTEGSLGLEVDKVRSRSGFRVLAVYGHEGEQSVSPGDFILEVNGTVPRDIAQFFALLHGKAGEPVSLLVTQQHKQRVDTVKVQMVRRPLLGLVRTEADRGDAAAQVSLGLFHLIPGGADESEDAQPPAKEEMEKGLGWLEKAYAQGNVNAAICLGSVYREGFGVEANWERASRYYKTASEANDASSQYVLADMYEKGLGVELNPRLAGEWYLKAAEGGIEEARLKVIELYDAGKIPPRDQKRAANLKGLMQHTDGGRQAYEQAVLLLNKPDISMEEMTEGQRLLRMSCLQQYVPAMKMSMLYQLRSGNVEEALRQMNEMKELRQVSDSIGIPLGIFIGLGQIPLVLWVVILPSLTAFAACSVVASIACEP
ncbi:MAG TPA: PDZ domain-containing protein, partial [Candidatus Methylacidiphilales bacterium]|nr:PDZ domain-containing protein [Candidatus Methylacidiphilales bacterium]